MYLYVLVGIGRYLYVLWCVLNNTCKYYAIHTYFVLSYLFSSANTDRYMPIMVHFFEFTYM